MDNLLGLIRAHGGRRVCVPALLGYPISKTHCFSTLIKVCPINTKCVHASACVCVDAVYGKLISYNSLVQFPMFNFQFVATINNTTPVCLCLCVPR